MAVVPRTPDGRDDLGGLAELGKEHRCRLARVETVDLLPDLDRALYSEGFPKSTEPEIEAVMVRKLNEEREGRRYG